MDEARYGRMVTEIVAWATEEPAVRSALVVGSQARARTPADRWSDLDIALFTRDPASLLASETWTSRFGRVILSFLEPTAVGGAQERRVLYEGGRDVDFAILPADFDLTRLGSREAAGVLGRGFRVLLDKDGAWADAPARLERVGPPVAPRPRAEELDSTVRDFWYHVLWTAKKAERGELWMAKSCCDGYLKRLMVRVLEWDAALSAGGQVDVWHEGRFLDRWVAEDLRPRIAGTFARYDRDDLFRALDETGRLFSDVARRVARACKWAYPDTMEAEVRRLVEDVRNARPT